MKPIAYLTALAMVWLKVSSNAMSEIPSDHFDKAPKTHSPVLIVISLGTTSEGFEDDTRAIASGDALKSPVLMRINDEPIGFFPGGGVLRSINEHLHDGRNTFTLEGNSSIPIYVKVIRQVSRNGKYEYDRLLAKDKIVLKDRSTALAFETHDLPNLEFDLLKDTATERSRYRMELTAIMDDLREQLSQKHFKTFAEKREGGMRIWLKDFYAEHDDGVWSKCINATVAELSLPGLAVPSEKAPLSFEWGAHSVLVSLKGSLKKNALGKSIQISVAGDDISPLPLQFVKLKGDWIIWTN